MKKIFVEKAQVLFLLRDADGIACGEFSVEVEGPLLSETKTERARMGIRLSGGEMPAHFVDLQRMPDLGDAVALCQQMCGPAIRLESKWRPRLQTSYRNEQKPISFWNTVSHAVSLVMLSYSRFREARETDVYQARTELFDALEILWKREHPLCDRDEEGRDCWWATCVLCNLDYRHYPSQSWRDEHGNRLDKPVPNVGCHDNDRLCEACEPKARRDTFTFGKGVALVGGHTADQHLEIITEKPGEDQKDPMRRLYEFFLGIFKERLG